MGRWRSIVAILLCLSAAVHAWQLRWLCDDAFISFRYARNLLRYGELAFNRGERVEGYTNFLWTVLLSGGMALGVAPETFSIAMGIAAYALLLWLSAQTAQQVLGRHWLLAVLPLVVHQHLSLFATSGLETMAFTLFVSAALFDFSLGRAPLWRGFLLLALAGLLRPDAMALYGGALAGMLLQALRTAPGSRPAVRRAAAAGEALRLLRLQAPAMLLFAAYWIWRWQYFGALFPNTFYAKSAAQAYWRQGAAYSAAYYGSYWMLPACALLVLLLALYRRLAAKERVRQMPAASSRAENACEERIAPVAGALLAWSLYVVWIGGDFMFARHLVVIAPLSYFLLARAMLWSVHYLREARSWTLALTVLVTAATALRADPYRFQPSRNWLWGLGIVEESAIYSRTGMQRNAIWLESLSPLIQRSGARLAFWGAGAHLIYYLDPLFAVEASTGLTEAKLARQNLLQRGRIGHEKAASVAYLRERAVDLSLYPPPPERDFGWNRLRLQGMPADFEIIRYRPQVMEKLAEHRELQFVNFPEYLDQYMKRNHALQELQRDAMHFEEYYFAAVSDQARYRRLQALLQAAER
ncbi:MAG: hypothetical protein K1X75_06755 [Leptospirales bacterium]|nr:hypothetical protein [Leptospirales bacterium]